MYPFGSRMRVGAQTLNQQRVTGIQDHLGQPHMVPTPIMVVHIDPEVFLMIAKLKCYERIQKMKRPYFRW